MRPCPHIDPRPNFADLLKPPAQCSCGCDSPDLWLCLACLNVGCGRLSKQAAELHSKQKKHPVVLKSTGEMLWCYVCDTDLLTLCDDIQREDKQTRKMKERVQFVKKAFFDKVFSAKKQPLQQMMQEEQPLPTEPTFDKGLIFGLNNIGNTCFFNSIMQCLNGCYQLCDVYLSKKIDLTSGKSPSPFRHKALDAQCQEEEEQEWVTKGKKQPPKKSIKKINQKFKEFLEEARKSRCHDPTRLFREIAAFKSTFASMAQQDSQQLLRFLLQGLAEGQDELLRVNKRFQKKFGKHLNNYSEAVFGGYLASHLHCLKCKHQSWTFDFVMDISTEIVSKPPALPFPKSFSAEVKAPYNLEGEKLTILGDLAPPSEMCSVEGSLYSFFSPQRLTKANYFCCQQCKNPFSEALRKFYLYRPPPILTVSLKRFRGVGTKNNTYVELSEQLQFVHVIGRSPEAVKYRLFAISVHGGSYYGGHYVAYVRHGGRWFYYSDSHWKETTWESVGRTQAYVLFYRRANACGDWLK